MTGKDIHMLERVRAILITPAGTMLAIRRTRPGQAVYWVLPGGHVDPGDADTEAGTRSTLSRNRRP
jgi:8-oxo-dGTP pyrophosphatase MutT (NUDIX family)